ncbi:phosphodiester glycosidase family protein [Myroides sp. M-43]|uniref:phosphodiester glycosidase family protein n=1 Tax=Myroides oncorhynchi TaxID=2893756 RepID=UPI001E2BEC87|nr:phosphodiester glycosidase family protein [Myroides oncorhynchi]MCC9044340.1 phosphodiester glycosidase family protein [Myroides oncorhynchi]
MRLFRISILFTILLLFSCQGNQLEQKYVIYQCDPAKENIKMYWKNEQGEGIHSLANLKTMLTDKGEMLVFAMNGGMFEPDNSPKGLYIENHQLLQSLDTLKGGNGNFYLQPNGVFYLTKDNQAKVVSTSVYSHNTTIQYATQSGPILLLNGEINTVFTQGSTNLNIRNGVGVKENGEVIFAMSKEKVNFYDFAKLFKELGCTNALYLDGFVSRAYLPSKGWEQTDGDFGVIIGASY